MTHQQQELQHQKRNCTHRTQAILNAVWEPSVSTEWPNQ